MKKTKTILNFNPSLSGSIEATVTTQSDKVENYFMSDTESMLMSSKPSIKSIKVINRYEANSEDGIEIYNLYKCNSL
jgi:hypothetical protein